MTRLASWLRFMLGAIALAGVIALSAPAQAQQAPIIDPDASVVNEQTLLRELPRIQGDIDQLDPRARVLIQPAGRVWDHFHEVTLYWGGAIVILGTLAALAAAYLLLGRIRISAGRSGRKVLRFKAVERFAHWLTAVSFVILGITGLNITFGKHLLLPLIGYDAFSVVSEAAKYAHNFTSFAFVIGLAFIVAIFIKDNIPDKTDIEWFRQGGGFIKSKHAPARRFNAGEKLVFWRPRRGPAGCRIRLSAAVPVLRHRHRRNAGRTGGARRHRRAVRRFDPRSHLYRHARNGGRVRGDVDRRGRLQLGEGTSRSLARRPAWEGPARFGRAVSISNARRMSGAGGHGKRSFED